MSQCDEEGLDYQAPEVGTDPDTLKADYHDLHGRLKLLRGLPPKVDGETAA